MAKTIEIPAWCSRRNHFSYCDSTGCLCSTSISTFVRNCPLADALDPETYQDAIGLLKETEKILCCGDNIAKDGLYRMITAFLSKCSPGGEVSTPISTEYSGKLMNNCPSCGASGIRDDSLSKSSEGAVRCSGCSFCASISDWERPRSAGIK